MWLLPSRFIYVHLDVVHCTSYTYILYCCIWYYIEYTPCTWSHVQLCIESVTQQQLCALSMAVWCNSIAAVANSMPLAPPCRFEHCFVCPEWILNPWQWTPHARTSCCTNTRLPMPWFLFCIVTCGECPVHFDGEFDKFEIHPRQLNGCIRTENHVTLWPTNICARHGIFVLQQKFMNVLNFVYFASGLRLQTAHNVWVTWHSHEQQKFWKVTCSKGHVRGAVSITCDIKKIEWLFTVEFVERIP